MRMAEETQTQPTETPKKKSFLLRLGVPAFIILVAAIAARLLYSLVLTPMFTQETNQTVAPAEWIPTTAETVTFDDSYASIIMPAEDMPTSILYFQVSLECANLMTKALVEKHKSRFNHIINQAHGYQRREELDDPRTKENIEKRILEQANNALKLLQEEPDPELRITAVFHEKFVIPE